jgi:hypothetical protein
MASYDAASIMDTLPPYYLPLENGASLDFAALKADYASVLRRPEGRDRGNTHTARHVIDTRHAVRTLVS